VEREAEFLYLQEIKKRANPNGIVIRFYPSDRFNKIETWMISGAGVQATGASFLETCDSWLNAVEYLENERK